MHQQYMHFTKDKNNERSTKVTQLYNEICYS